MKKLLKYKDGAEYVVEGINNLHPIVDYEPEEYDLSELTDKEFKRFKENKKDKKLRDKMKKIKNG